MNTTTTYNKKTEHEQRQLPAGEQERAARAVAHSTATAPSPPGAGSERPKTNKLVKHKQYG